MANTDNTAYSPTFRYFPPFSAPKASVGRLRLLGHNISMDYPISLDVSDDEGNAFGMNLEQMLQRLDQFEDGTLPDKTADVLLSCCMIARKYSLMTDEEKVIFEAYLKKNNPAFVRKFTFAGVEFSGGKKGGSRIRIDNLATGQCFDLPCDNKAELDEIIAGLSPEDAFSVGFHYRQVVRIS